MLLKLNIIERLRYDLPKDYSASVRHEYFNLFATVLLHYWTVFEYDTIGFQFRRERVNIINPDVDSPSFVRPWDRWLTRQHHRNTVSAQHGKSRFLANRRIDTKAEFICEKSDGRFYSPTVDI